MRLKDKIAVVTASTRGIGAAIAETFAREGAKVYLAARSAERAKIMIDRLTKEGCFVSFVYNDALKQETYKSMIEEIVEKEGRLDILVNNFGTSNADKDLDIQSTEYAEFLKTLDLNIGSVFLASQAVIPHMAKNGGGSIINISSVGGSVPDISQIGYGTSKAAINYLTKLIATQNFQDFFLKHTPIKRMGTPDNIAQAVLYFASDESSFTTGQIMEVSGGFGMPTPIFGDMIELKNRR